MLKRKFLYFLRKLVGTQQILDRLDQQDRQQKKQLLLLGNGMKYFFADLEKVKTTGTYKRCAEIVSLLSPMDVIGEKYIRVGKDFDGGYVMLDNFQKGKIEAAYSFGIFDDVSWDENIACRGIDVFMYDHTIEQLPKNYPNFHYFKTGVTGSEKGAGLKTLSELIADNNHTRCNNLIMKMDIEGCEWDVFKDTPSSTINQFSQIVLEFHDLDVSMDSGKLDVLKKINETHQSVYVHANNSGFPMWIGPLVISPLLEVTYVRRNDFKDKFVANTRQFPTEIDQPNISYFPDVYLGNFSDDVKPKG